MADTSRPTDADRMLVRKTDEELRAEVSKYSFDLASLNRRIKDDDLALAFIQTHLYLDHVVSCMLTEGVPFPRQLQLDRAGLSQKLQLVSALGLLRPTLIGPARVVNSIRNKIAHQLDYVVQATDEARLRATLAKGVDQREDGRLFSLAETLRIITVLVDIERQERAYERLQRLKAQANLRIVIDDVENNPVRWEKS